MKRYTHISGDGWDRSVDDSKTLGERLWRMLPDKCQCLGCSRVGVRGNENVVGGKIVCDYCYLKSDNLLLWSSWWDRHPRLRWPVLVATMLYIAGGAICFTIAMSRVQ